jgi:hypothetical protein
MSKLKVAEKQAALCDVVLQWHSEIIGSASITRAGTTEPGVLLQDMDRQDVAEDDDWEDLEDDF